MATKRSKFGTASIFDTHYETERHFKNVFYEQQLPVECFHEDSAKRNQMIKDHIKSFVEAIVNTYPPEVLSQTGDFSAYSGSCGVALMFFRLYERTQHSNSNDSSNSDYYFSMTRKYAELSVKMYSPSKRKPLLTFWCGGPGPFALMAVLHKMNKEDQKSKEYLDKILEFTKWVHDDSFESDELLYGRAGLLYSLMWINKYLKDDSLHNTCIEIAKVILKRGKKLKSGSPLMYEWHEKRYFAGAHGVAGILYLILDLKEIMNDEQYKSDIIGSIDFLASQEFPSGNYPTREGGTTDELVQWCHGATAILMLFCKAERILKESKWRKHAERAANCIWKRGLLKKGVGLCHGISGNGYALLSLHNLTLDPIYYEQAWKFCEFSWSEKGAITYNKPDEPYSLANGMAGAVTFYLDMLDPQNANWIGFDV